MRNKELVLLSRENLIRMSAAFAGISFAAFLFSFDIKIADINKKYIDYQIFLFLCSSLLFILQGLALNSL